jgi:SAM-dependent methyltransferase
MTLLAKIAKLLRPAVLETTARVRFNSYEQGGRIPWSEGYSKYRSALVTSVLKSPDVLSAFENSLPLPDNFGFKIDERVVELPWVASRLGPGNSVLDAGCAFFKYPAARERISEHNSVTLIALDAKDMTFDLKARSVDRVQADLREIPLPSESFDSAICISTIEHVGMDNTQLYTSNDMFRENKADDYLKVASELARVIRTNGNLYITVPFGKFKNHGWLQVFDGAMVDRLISSTGCQLIAETIYRHGPTGWQLSNRQTSADAIYFDVHSKDADARSSNLAAAEAVVCLHLRRI